MQTAWQFSLAYTPFVPHGHCYLWKPGLMGLHITSDALTAIAYYSIPLTLTYFVHKRQDLPFDWIFQLFSAFIIACGTTHLLEIWTLWHPAYWAAGAIKALTAGVSLYTAVALVPLVPKALSLPSPAQLAAANRELEREIAERKQIEESLRQSQARYRAVVEDQTELICRFLPDRTLTFANQACCRYFEKPLPEMLGQSFEAVIFAEDLEQVKTQLNALSPEHSVTTLVHRVVYPNREMRIHQWIYRMIADQAGHCVEFQAVGRDITELQQAETALQESQRFIEKITHTAPVLLYVYDLVAKCNIYINREVTAILGYAPEEVQAMGDNVLRKIMHPDDFVLLPEHHLQWQTAKDNDIFTIEFRMRHSSGEWRYFQGQETLFARTAEALPWQILGTLLDISDRKITQQLQTALKEKEILLQEIHHRVKNNLQIVYSLLRLQRRRVQDPKAAEILLDSQNRIKSIALIHEKLYRSASLSEIALAQYIPNIAANLFSTYRIDSSRITLQTEIADIPLDVDTAILCGLIINELVSNALKYAFREGETGRVSIEISLINPDTILIGFRDNGIGFPDDLDLVGTTSIGLKLVKDLVGQLEGEIEMKNQQGAAFRITFPWRKL